MSDITPADALRELGDDQAEYAAAAAKKEIEEILAAHGLHDGYAVDRDPWFACGCGWVPRHIHRFGAHRQHRSHVAEIIAASLLQVTT